MRNIEIKARIDNREVAEAIAVDLCGPKPHARIHQVDTYFDVPEGRLKLREEDDSCELIFYRRLDKSEHKRGVYELAQVDSPEELRCLIGAAFGVMAIVRKERTVYLFKNVRMHLDEVDGLGSFIELEAVMQDALTEAEAESLIKRLMVELSVKPEGLVKGSYCDMVVGIR